MFCVSKLKKSIFWTALILAGLKMYGVTQKDVMRIKKIPTLLERGNEAGFVAAAVNAVRYDILSGAIDRSPQSVAQVIELYVDAPSETKKLIFRKIIVLEVVPHYHALRRDKNWSIDDVVQSITSSGMSADYTVMSILFSVPFLLDKDDSLTPETRQHILGNIVTLVLVPYYIQLIDQDNWSANDVVRSITLSGLPARYSNSVFFYIMPNVFDNLAKAMAKQIGSDFSSASGSFQMRAAHAVHSQINYALDQTFLVWPQIEGVAVLPVDYLGKLAVRALYALAIDNPYLTSEHKAVLINQALQRIQWLNLVPQERQFLLELVDVLNTYQDDLLVGAAHRVGVGLLDRLLAYGLLPRINEPNRYRETPLSAANFVTGTFLLKYGADPLYVKDGLQAYQQVFMTSFAIDPADLEGWDEEDVNFLIHIAFQFARALINRGISLDDVIRAIETYAPDKVNNIVVRDTIIQELRVVSQASTIPAEQNLLQSE